MSVEVQIHLNISEKNYHLFFDESGQLTRLGRLVSSPLFKWLHLIERPDVRDSSNFVVEHMTPEIKRQLDNAKRILDIAAERRQAKAPEVKI